MVFAAISPGIFPRNTRRRKLRITYPRISGRETTTAWSWWRAIWGRTNEPGVERMNEVASRLAREYSAAMRDYLAGQGEAALRRAYEAGRQALSEGLGVLEMVAAHQEAVIGVL